MTSYRTGKQLIQTVEDGGLGSIDAATGGCLRIEAEPTFPTAHRQLLGQSMAGHRNPMGSEISIPIDMSREGALSFEAFIRRAAAYDSQPMLATWLESAGYLCSVGGVTTTTGTQSDVLITVTSATGMAAGEAILLERDSGLYVPVLIHDVDGTALHPTIAMDSAAAASAVVEQMYTLAPVADADEPFAVPSGKTLQFWLQTALPGVAADSKIFKAKGCALSSLGSIVFGPVGTPIKLTPTFHIGAMELEDEAMAADSFLSRAEFLVVTSDCEFAFAPYNAGSQISTLKSVMVQSMTFNPNFSLAIDKGAGKGVLNDVQGYCLVQSPPTCEIVATYRADTDFEDSWHASLGGPETDVYIHAVQPTRSLSTPAFGVWMPRARLLPGSEPTFDFSGDLVTVRATFQGDVGGLGSSDDITDQTGAPIYIAASGMADPS